MKTSTSSPAKLVIALVLLVAVIPPLLLLVYPNHFRRLHSLVVTGQCARNSSIDAGAGAAQEPDLIRILIGVLTLPGLYERRHLLRGAYALQRPDFAAVARVDVRFVFCNLINEEHRVLVAMEIMLHDDILILDCAENMNGGKTYTYFSSLPRLFAGDDRPPYVYVMKTDDDTYVRLANLAMSLRALPRKDVYYGFLTPCEGGARPDRFMSGMGYVLSWDLVEWIATSETVAAHKDGPEDIVTERWLRSGGRGRNRFDMNPAMYDYMVEPPLCYRHKFVPDTIAVHKLKNNLKWARTLNYFNVTRGLKPSKLYHINFSN